MYLTGIKHVTKRITVAVSETDYQTLQSLALENDRSIVAQMGRMIRTWSEVNHLAQTNVAQHKPTKVEQTKFNAKPILTPEEEEARYMSEPTWISGLDTVTGETWDKRVTRAEALEHDRLKAEQRQLKLEQQQLAERNAETARNMSMDTEALPIFKGEAEDLDAILGGL